MIICIHVYIYTSITTEVIVLTQEKGMSVVYACRQPITNCYIQILQLSHVWENTCNYSLDSEGGLSGKKLLACRLYIPCP